MSNRSDGPQQASSDISPITSGKAIASLTLALLSPFVCVLASLPAVVVGFLGLSDIRNSQGRLKGRGMALAGVWIGGVHLLLTPIILILLLLPAISSARSAAEHAQSSNNLKQISLAVLNYESAKRGFPPRYQSDTQGRPAHSWRVLILPFLGEQYSSLYSQYRFDEPWDGPNNSQLARYMPAEYRLPNASPDDVTTPYLAISGPGTMFDQDKSTRYNSIQDGSSATILFVEVREKPVHWMQPEDFDVAVLVGSTSLELTSLGTGRKGRGILVAFADGSVRSLPIDTPIASFRALCTIAGQELLEPSVFE